MYRYLDRPICELEAADRLLVWAMRSWVAAIRSGRCPCSALGPAFAGWRIQALLPDFNTAMLVLNGEARGTLRLAPLHCGRIGDDEAALLALFATGLGGTDGQLRRMAAHLVQPDAVSHLAIAAERVSALLSHARPVWDIPGVGSKRDEG